MTSLDRDKIVSLLAQLGESDDTEVLIAARELHTLVVENGAEWEELLAPSTQSTEAPEAVPVPSSLVDSDVISLIEQLMAREDLAESTREELEGYREDISEGEFTDADRRYLQALAARL